MPRRRAKSVVFRTPLEKRKLKSARNNSRNDASNYEATSSSFTGFITSTPRKANAHNRSSSHQKEGKESPLFEKSIRLTSFVESASGKKTHRKVGRPPGKKSSYVKKNNQGNTKASEKSSKVKHADSFIKPSHNGKKLLQESDNLPRDPTVNLNASSVNLASSNSSRISSRRLAKSNGESSRSRKRKMSNENELENIKSQEEKRHKASSNAEVSSVSSEHTVKSRRKISKRANVATSLNRIRDVNVTKKSFQKWKPLSARTINFVEDAISSVILNVVAEANIKDEEESEHCLIILKQRVVERLQCLKAPYTKEDYKKMEAENKQAKNAYHKKDREVNTLEKKIEDEQRDLDKQKALVAKLNAKLEGLKEVFDTVEVHPLLEQTENSLQLPKLPDDYDEQDVDG
ncbi:uncharacterized protein LOC124439954 isoform X2 [Xenia sp. Carnegie-2017]|uniref:uncharacterized protein LOC124439954 isoform X2 n=1 Tax=Xenia sp. Carnegie-2017 TaxID=2897299 RepID=UPI001F0440D7|nr:uncharacterized protein LOC124439954 isoform X2 [Xenia sp. Carnegie-2017]